MESQAPAIAPSPSQPSETTQSQPSQPPQTPSSSSTPSVSAPIHSSPNPNPIQNQIQTPNSKPPTSLPHQSASPGPPQSRPPTTFNRTLPQQQPHYPHFSSSLSSLPASSASASSGSSFPSIGPPSVSGTSAPRGGMAIGIPAHQGPSPPFSSSFGQHFGGLGRTGVSTADSASNSSSSQVRPPTQGMGMLGSLGSSSQVRPVGIAAHQHRPAHSSLRPPSASNNQSTNSQSFQGHGLIRPSSAGSPASPSPNASQSMQSLNQPWLSSTPQGKPPLPSPSYRQQLNSQSLQPRSHIPPQQQKQQLSSSNQLQEHMGQQMPLSRPLHVPHQPQITRVQGPGTQRPPSLVAVQPGAVQAGLQSQLANVDTEESCDRILSKRSIQELVNQVDPSEKLDPEVADILVDIAENFLESITRSGCILAKHRKSSMLEAKDILLHLEKNWNMTLPGFGGEEIKSYKRPPTSDIHKERLAAIKKSMVATEAAHAKGSSGQASGGSKASQPKTPGNVIGSPNFKSP